MMGSRIAENSDVEEKQASATETFDTLMDSKNVIQCNATINPTAIMLRADFHEIAVDIFFHFK